MEWSEDEGSRDVFRLYTESNFGQLWDKEVSELELILISEWSFPPIYQ